MKTILVVDVGNTSTVIGLAVDRRVRCVCRVPTHARGYRRLSTLAVRRLAARRHIAGAVLCSVVPAVNRTWQGVLRQSAGVRPMLVTHRLKLGIGIDYPHPATIGADRLANACAAAARYGAPVIVADFGTALTFDIVSAQGNYVGGVIAPGLPLMTDYLAERTALLPHIRLGGTHGRIGKSTAEAMRIGANIGYRGIVREILAFLGRGRKGKPARLAATGGYAAYALGGLRLPIDIRPNLTLEGLVQIFYLNS